MAFAVTRSASEKWLRSAHDKSVCQSTAGDGACDVCSGRAGASEDDDVPGDELIALVEQEALVEVDVCVHEPVG